MTELNKRIAEMTYDGLFAGLTPPAQVGAGTIAAVTEETVFPRGTVFAKKDGTLRILGTEDGGTPDCVLCDDITLAAGEGATVPVYTAGCFNADKLTAADGYTVTDADNDALRVRSVILR